MSTASPEKRMRKLLFHHTDEMVRYVGYGIDTRTGQRLWEVPYDVAIELVGCWPLNWAFFEEVYTEKGRAPRVTAVMPTTVGREWMAEMAIDDFRKQSWPEKELVIVNEGDRLLTKGLRDQRITEVMVERGRANGWRRNVGDRLATGDFIIRWDDDDIHGPERMKVQLEGAIKADCLASTLTRRVHYSLVDNTAWVQEGRGDGLLLYRRDGKRYEEDERRDFPEDSVFWHHYAERAKQVNNAPELYIRVYHGGNICSKEHVETHKPKEMRPGGRAIPEAAREYVERRIREYRRRWVECGGV